MPLNSSTIVTTVGSATANSYVSLTEFADYRDLQRIDADSFDAADPDDKIRALVIAFKRLNRENWMGSRVDSTQAAAWPRFGVQKVDKVEGWGYGGAYSYGYGSYPYGYPYGTLNQYLSTEIPQQIKDAQCELALSYLDGFDDGEEDQIKSFSADGVAVEFRPGKIQGGLPAVVSQLIGNLAAGNQLRRA